MPDESYARKTNPSQPDPMSDAGAKPPRSSWGTVAVVVGLALMTTVALVLGLVSVLGQVHDGDVRTQCIAAQINRQARATMTAIEGVSGASGPAAVATVLARWKDAQQDIVRALEAC